MPWDEATRITRLLTSDPASHIGASVAGWDYPVSREGLIAMDKFDLDHQIAWRQGGGKGKKPDPYPRPWKTNTETRRRGNATGRTPQEVREILADFGHPIPPEEATHG